MLYRFSNGNSCEAAILHNSQAEYEYLLQLAEQYYKPVATRAACAGSLYLVAYSLRLIWIWPKYNGAIRWGRSF